ncbi:MAG: 4'-phosphopantetheinyl transferase superfamily protein [Clostridia bacterium]|nr:4'-phosphopantetheinyl transferase superfamily protein [Clostridia bacterium]
MKKAEIYLINTRTVKEKEEYIRSFLPEDRVEKADRYARESDRLLSLGAGYLVYRFVGECYVDDRGKPGSDRLFFSISHSGELAALAVTPEGEIGIDIEEASQDRDFEALAEFAFGDEELESFKKGEHFLRIFTAKESLAKAEGSGLRNKTKLIPALPLDGTAVYKNKTYFRHTLDVDGYFGSVTLEGDDFLMITEVISDL